MARYLERAQQTTRLLDANIHLSLGAPFRFEGSLSVPALE
ncbi:MAG: alpha-E domain-containing protein, partial [Bradyrhizobium sp.]